MNQPIKNLSSWAGSFLDQQLTRAAQALRKPELAEEYKSKINEFIGSLPESASAEFDRLLAVARQNATYFTDLVNPEKSVDLAVINASGVLMHPHAHVPARTAQAPLAFSATWEHPEAAAAVDRALQEQAAQCAHSGALVAANIEAAIVAIIKSHPHIRTLVVPRCCAITLPSGVSLTDLVRSTHRKVVEIGSVDGWSPDLLPARLGQHDQSYGLITADRPEGDVGCVADSNSDSHRGIGKLLELNESSPMQHLMHVSLYTGPSVATQLIQPELPSLESLAKDTALVTAGDQLLGGPEVGVIFAKQELRDTISHGLPWRWLRASLPQTASLAMAMQTWNDEDRGEATLPALLETSHTNLLARAGRLKIRIESDERTVTLLEHQVKAPIWNRGPWHSPSVKLQITQSAVLTQELVRRLRRSRPRVLIAPQSDEQNVVLDLRWVAPSFDSVLARLLETPRDESGHVADAANASTPSQGASNP